MERHIVTIISSLTAIGVIWIGASIVELKTTVAGLGDRFALRTELDTLRIELQRVATEQARRTALFDRIKDKQ